MSEVKHPLLAIMNKIHEVEVYYSGADSDLILSTLECYEILQHYKSVEQDKNKLKEQNEKLKEALMVIRDDNQKYNFLPIARADLIVETLKSCES